MVIKLFVLLINFSVSCTLNELLASTIFLEAKEAGACMFPQISSPSEILNLVKVRMIQRF